MDYVYPAYQSLKLDRPADQVLRITMSRGKINAMEKRKLLARLPHPDDGRALGLYLTDAGQHMMVRAEKTATELEQDAASRLSSAEKKTLLKLLQKVYF